MSRSMSNGIGSVFINPPNPFVSSKDLIRLTYEKILADGKIDGGSTTVCCGVISLNRDGNVELDIANVGDSGCFVYRDTSSLLGRCISPTSEIHPGLNLGFQTEEQRHGSGHNDPPFQLASLGRFGGSSKCSDDPNSAQCFKIVLLPGDHIIFSTDGFRDNIRESTVRDILNTKSLIHYKSKMIVEECVRNSWKPDDITVIVVKVCDYNFKMKTKGSVLQDTSPHKIRPHDNPYGGPHSSPNPFLETNWNTKQNIANVHLGTEITAQRFTFLLKPFFGDTNTFRSCKRIDNTFYCGNVKSVNSILRILRIGRMMSDLRYGSADLFEKILWSNCTTDTSENCVRIDIYIEKSGPVFEPSDFRITNNDNILVISYGIIKILEMLHSYDISYKRLTPESFNVIIDPRLLTVTGIKLSWIDMFSGGTRDSRKYLYRDAEYFSTCVNIAQGKGSYDGIRKLSPKIDIWSAGVIIGHLLMRKDGTTRIPFAAPEPSPKAIVISILQNFGWAGNNEINTENDPSILSEFDTSVDWNRTTSHDPLIVDLLRCMFKFTSSLRYSAAQLVNHPVFRLNEKIAIECPMFVQMKERLDKIKIQEPLFSSLCGSEISVTGHWSAVKSIKTDDIGPNRIIFNNQFDTHMDLTHEEYIRLHCRPFMESDIFTFRVQCISKQILIEMSTMEKIDAPKCCELYLSKPINNIWVGSGSLLMNLTDERQIVSSLCAMDDIDFDPKMFTQGVKPEVILVDDDDDTPAAKRSRYA
jgi:serine/threonine protein phosphatase PrpC